jgi:transcriptional regulator with XRE-family HTH domain
MNTTSKKHEDVLQSFNSLFENLTEQDILDNEARLLMFRFLDIIDHKREEMGWTRKQLAAQLGTSASYITQLFRGDKLVNMPFLAKIQKVFDFRFDISETKSYQEETVNILENIWPGKNKLKTFDDIFPKYKSSDNIPFVEPESKAA